MATIDKVSLDIQVVLGCTDMPVHQVLRLGRGAIIELDATEVRILANTFRSPRASSWCRATGLRSRSRNCCRARPTGAEPIPGLGPGKTCKILALVRSGPICYIARRLDAVPFGRRPLQCGRGGIGRRTSLRC